MDRIQIGPRWVGEGEPCFIIAEAGSNHNGSFEQALRLIDVAKEAGADVVKFQNFKASHMYPPSAGYADYLNAPKTIYRIIEEAEMPEDWVPKLAEHCRSCDIEFMSTPFDESSADFLEPYLNAYKIASYELTHIPLACHIARKGKPIILSTGTSNLDDVKQTVEAIQSTGNEDLILLQCTACYPTPLEAINVRAMETLRDATGLSVGLSDHSREPCIAPLLALALGACVIEKHFTLSNRLPGPDHRYAVEPPELREMVRKVRDAEKALGHGRKEVLREENELHAFARRSVFAICDISKGEAFSQKNLAVLRRGNLAGALEPRVYAELMGRKSSRAIKADHPIQEEDVVWRGDL
jgi:N-acetylneuraminate synthase